MKIRELLRRRFNKDDFEKYFVISDLHSVYLDKKAFRVFLDVYKANEGDLIINGDLLDLPMLMGADKHRILVGEKECKLDDELDFTIQEILTPLKKAKKANITLKIGNHEDRLYRILAGNAPGLKQLVQAGLRRPLQLERMLELDRLGVTLSRGDKRNGRDTDVDFIRKTGGRAAVVHGYLTAKSRMKTYLTHFQCSGTSGHTHRMECDRLPWYGGVHFWQESGCLCRLNAVEYLPVGKDPGWSHGFVTIWVNKKNGEVFVKGHEIKNYEVEYHGTIYDA